MLQHNARASGGRPAHLAHAALIGLHALCCGLPALALGAAALSGTASGVALFSDSVGQLHDFLHGRELWILAASAVLVLLGAAMEANARRGGHSHGFPWLFAFSALCFLANVALIAVHRA